MRYFPGLKRAVICAIGAFAVASTSVAQADGPRPAPEEIAHECIDAMRETTRATSEHIRGAAEHGIGHMVHLARDGAPDGAIAYAARGTVERIDDIARHGKRRVYRLARRCVAVLRELDAPAPIIQAVIDARDIAMGNIKEAAVRAKRHVREALHRLTSDETRVSDVAG